MTDFLARRSISALRARKGDAEDRSPAPSSPGPTAAPGAGEPVLSQGMKIALLKMRGSDWSKAVLAHLKATECDVSVTADYFMLANIGLAVRKGSFHVLTPSGRWRADRIIQEIARAGNLHTITYDYGSFGRAAFWCCSCGARSYKARHIGNYVGHLVKGARLHLEHVGAVVKRDVA